MSTQQDIYAAGSENRPPMLNKENYIPWSSRLLRYDKSRPNGKLIYNSIMNGLYVRQMIPEPEIWLRVQQMMKGSDIGIQEKKAKLFNEWERFTSTDRESIESYYHRFSKLMNDFKRNKHFPEKIASNLKFLNNLQPEWSRHVTIVYQTKDLHTADYTQLYDFLKYNQKEVDELRDERLAKTQDPLALMANSNNSFKYPMFHPDLPSSSTYIQQPIPNNNNYIPQPSFNQNYMQKPMPNLEDITDPTAAMNTALTLMAKAFKLNYSTPTNNNQRISSNPRNRQIAQPGMILGQDNQMQMVGGNGGNQFRQYAWQNVGNQVVQNAVQNPGVQNIRNQNGVIVVLGIAHQNGNGNVVAARAEGNANGNNADLDENEEVNANCILMANLQQASTSVTQTDKAPIYDSNGAAEVQLHNKCYNDEIFNMFTQEKQYTELLEPIQEPHQVQQNDSNVIFEVSSVEQSGGTVKQHPVTVEETRAYQESSLLNLVTEVEKVNMSVYQDQCLTKKINALHLSSGNQITTLNEELSNLNKQLSKEKSAVSSLLEEKKRLKSDFKIREDEFLDK
ncbi:hypothetical protein Tco_0317214 [Tanacetum coccineum]